MQGNERWPPTNPSARLRAARVMPQWITARGTTLPPPPPPPDDPLPPEPEYEVIEFPGQQTYSNQPVIRNKDKEKRRCDLCGSSAPAVRCMQCVQQNFCYSCDDMYHRHPKRQSHIRRELDTGGGRPPLPPKGEPPPPPVPPPRRNKRSTPRPPPQPPAHIPPPSPHLLQRESASPKPGFVGSLKKMIGVGHAPGVSQTLDRQHSLPPHSSMIGFHEQQMMNCNGFPEWPEVQRGHRSGSFSALNQPAFGHIMQAQSVAHLNCPSCHGHGVWTPWGGMPQTGTWQSSNFLNRAPPKEDWTDSDSDAALQRERLRRFSTMTARAPKSYMFDDTHSVRGGRKTDIETSSHKGGRRRDHDTLSNHGGGRKNDFDTMSSRGGRRKDFDTMSNRGGRKQDFDTMSLRGGRKSDIESFTNRPHKKIIEEKPSRKLVDDRYRNDTPESESSYERESEDDFKSTRHGRKVMSDLEDVQRGRRRSQPASPITQIEKIKSTPKNKRNERFSDTGRRRSSPINYKYESPSEEENDLAMEKKEEEHHKGENGVETVPDDPEEEEEELGPVPDCEWECVHCTFVNEGGSRVCAVCCKTSSKPKLIKEQDTPTKSSQSSSSKTTQPSPSKNSQPSPSKSSQPSPLRSSQNTPVKGQHNSYQKLEDDFKKNLNLEDKGTNEVSSLKSDKSERMKEKRGTQSPERTPLLTSKGTSPPPQSISTQTYEEAGQKLKRATSLADYGDWKAPQRSASRQSLLSDTQSLPVTPPRSRSPEQFRNTIMRRPSDLFSQRSLKRAGSQPPEYISSLVQKQVKQGLEMVKLLREAEEHQFSAEDLAVALLHCGDGDPIIWLQNNWRNMIDTVVTLSTNYGQERKENTIGTISASEAREALRTNDGNVWAAVTECVEQRQRKYGELLARGNFSREDIVTALTATHGNVEEAYKELNKNQLKPFLMRIWGPPQGADNDDGDFTKLAHGDLLGRGGKNIEEVSVDLSVDSNYERIQNWLENHVYNSNKNSLSQSMLQLNAGGISRSGSELKMNNLLDTKSSSTVFKNRRNSDVQRYLTTLYNANNKTLFIKNHSTSIQNLFEKSYSEYKFPINKESSSSMTGKLMNENPIIDKNNNDGDVETITIQLNPTIIKSEDLPKLPTEAQASETDSSSEESDSESGSEDDDSSECGEHTNEENNLLKVKEQHTQNSQSISLSTSERSDANENLSRSNSATSNESFESVHSSVENRELTNHINKQISPRKTENKKNKARQRTSESSSEPDYVNISELRNNGNEREQILDRKLYTEYNQSKTNYADGELLSQSHNEESVSTSIAENLIDNNNKNLTNLTNIEKSINKKTEKVITKNSGSNSERTNDYKNISSSVEKQTSIDNSISTNESEEKFMEMPSDDEIPFIEAEMELSNTILMQKAIPVAVIDETEESEDEGNFHYSEIPDLTGNSNAKKNHKESAQSVNLLSPGNKNVTPYSKASSDNNDAISNDFSEESLDYDEGRHYSPVSPLKRDPSLRFSEGNSEKDFSSIPTDSEKEMFFDTNKGKEAKHNNAVNSLPSNQVELLELLKKSLSKDDVVEKIVSTLFATVLQASVQVNNNESKKIEIIKQEDAVLNNNTEMNDNNETVQFQNNVEHESFQKAKKESLLNLDDMKIQKNITPESSIDYSGSQEMKKENEELFYENLNLVEDEFQISPENELSYNNLNQLNDKSKLNVEGINATDSTKPFIYQQSSHQTKIQNNHDAANNLTLPQEANETSKSNQEIIEVKNSIPTGIEIKTSVPHNTELRNLKHDRVGPININNISEPNETDSSIHKDTEAEKSIPEGDETGNSTLYREQSISEALIIRQIPPVSENESLFQKGNVINNLIVEGPEIDYSIPNDLEIEDSIKRGGEIKHSIHKSGKGKTSITEGYVTNNSIPEDTKIKNIVSKDTNINNSMSEDTEIINTLTNSTVNEDAIQEQSKIINPTSGGDKTGLHSQESNELKFLMSPHLELQQSISSSSNTDLKKESDTPEIKSSSQDTPKMSVLKKQNSPTKSMKKGAKPSSKVETNNINISVNKIPKTVEEIPNEGDVIIKQIPANSTVESKIESNEKNKNVSANLNNIKNTIIQDNNIVDAENISSNSPEVKHLTEIEIHTAVEEDTTNIFDAEREARRLLAEGLVKTYEQAEIAVQLKELNLEDDVTLAAANECHSLEAAIAFLQQECQLCAGKYTVKEMVSMLECEHRCCLECANNYFSLQITEKSINDCVCPFCKEPDILHIEEDKALTYFSHLDIFLKGIVKENIHELFQRKLRDRTLMQDPNFKWCIKCSSGFIANPRQKRFMCPDCKAITCAKCMKPWEKEHEKMSCEEYKKWLQQNDPEHQLEKHLDENGVTCPKCRTKYLLAKGGCMHLTCPQCKYEFCSGCSKPFLMGRKCTVSEYCEKLGLHSHHPRNCLFYLRDKEPEELERLLEDHKIEFRRGNDNDSKRCGVQLLKETADGFVEAICGHATVKAGLCKTHYVESLVLRIRMNNVDPVKLLDFGEAMQELRRNGKELPERPAGMSEFNYRQILYKVIEEEIPLE